EGRAMDITVEGTHSFVFKNGIIGHNCEDTSMLVGSMLESIGYRTRLVIGSVPEGYHMWVEVVDSGGQWWLVETTLGMVYKLDNRASLGYEADYYISWRNGCEYLHKAEDALY
ncbi:MAG: transglutaminase domain-containing protein, partial [Dehalococcoidales bacterium]|nr:transglutaminase domain-containing protein [Dehalococcoidales bacterium]